MTKTNRAANLSPELLTTLAEVCRWYASSYGPMTVKMVHASERELVAVAELNRRGLVDATGSSYDWERSWAVPTELAFALYELVDSYDSPYFEPRDAFETRLVERRWAQLPLPGVLA